MNQPLRSYKISTLKENNFVSYTVHFQTLFSFTYPIHRSRHVHASNSQEESGTILHFNRHILACVAGCKLHQSNQD